MTFMRMGENRTAQNWLTCLPLGILIFLGGGCGKTDEKGPPAKPPEAQAQPSATDTAQKTETAPASNRAAMLAQTTRPGLDDAPKPIQPPVTPLKELTPS